MPETVLIHDGARPFVTDEIICSVISALGTHNAVACAVKLKDTVKQVDKNGYVLSTPIGIRWSRCRPRRA